MAVEEYILTEVGGHTADRGRNKAAHRFHSSRQHCSKGDRCQRKRERAMRKGKKDMAKQLRLARPGVLVGGMLLVLLFLAGSVIAWRTLWAKPAKDLTLHVQVIADIPLGGGASRFDYQRLDAQKGLLFIAHLGASAVSVFDIRRRKVVADIPAIPGVHGVL